ncbi:hypothetical protein Mapa_012650 [Marchantia paleacea]|nr:hypothetical protein Mapa_012650 [Marchantia paleacea]
MDQEEKCAASIRKKLSDLVRPEKGTSDYDRYYKLLRDEIGITQCLQLRGQYDLELGCWVQSLSDVEAAALVEVLQEADMSRLAKLDLSQNLLDERTIVAVFRVLESGRCGSLTHLDLSETSYNVGMESSRAIAAALRTGHLSGFRHLSLPPCHVPTIAEALRSGEVSNLDHVNLEGSRELEQRSNEMREVLDVGLLSGVVHLSLRNCCLEADAVAVLARAMESNSGSKLKHLDLSWNPLRHGGSVAIAGLWSSGHLSNLEYLSLCKCEILDRGMRVISEAMSGRASVLKVLNVEENKIGDAGIAELLKALRSGHLPQLEALIVRFNWIQEEGMLALANFLEEGRFFASLKELHLFEVNVSERSARAFVSAYSSNEALTLQLKKFPWPNTYFETNAEKFRKRNVAFASARNNLKDEKDVPATTGKAFLCGFQMVGKTTLRRTLQQSKIGAVYRCMKSGSNVGSSSTAEPRTRGIEVTHIVNKGKGGQPDVVLAIWDLAGQAEYRVLHSAFCLAEGKATIFVIVCNATYPLGHSETELLFWLRFVASSCEPGIKRHVLVVLNCFDGRDCSELVMWVDLIRKQKDTFRDLLHIFATPFVLDARKRASVVDLKSHLTTLCRELLQGQFMPGICQNLPKFLDKLKANPDFQKFPVLTLDKFLLQFRVRNKYQSEGNLMAALEFLHEAGSVVFFKKDRLKMSDPDIAVSGLVVLDPNWFCQRVVGELLLPDSILQEEQSSVRSIVEEDGSISLKTLHLFLQQNLGTEPVSWVVAMLMCLGLCYRGGVGNDRVLVPALIKKDDMDRWEKCGVREATACQWVMGRSLTLMDSAKTALPAALFRRLQVSLARDPGCESYTASKSSTNFNIRRMSVLLQFDVSEKDPEERIDILVKPLGLMDDDPGSVRKQQLNVIEDIMDKLEPISIFCCPGVQFHRKVIKPWSTATSTPSMKDRTLKSVEFFKKKVEEQGLGSYSNWYIDGQCLRYDDLLSAEDLDGLEKTIGRRCKGLEEDVLELGIDVDDTDFNELSRAVPVEELQLSPESSCIVREIRREGLLTRSEVRLQGKLVQNQFDTMVAELQRSIKFIYDKQNQILRKVHAFHSYSVAEKESSLPRFLYLKKSSASGSWITVKEAFGSTFHVHLLCEARSDNGYLHEVEGQEGVEITNPKKWVRKLQPLLEWSLAIAIVVARVVGVTALPGLGLLLPNLSYTEGANLALVIESVATLGETALRSGDHQIDAPGSSPQHPINLKDRAVAAETLKDFIEAVGRAEFWQKVGLRKAVLRDKDGNLAKCAWICEKCYNCYKKNGILVADITP